MPTMSRAGKFMDAARKKIDLESFQKKKKIVNNKLAMILVNAIYESESSSRQV